MSFGAIAPFDGPACLIAIGVLSLSPSVNFEGVAGTFNGWGLDIIGESNDSKKCCSSGHCQITHNSPFYQKRHARC